MTKFNTGNPVGSADPRDLFDTAQVADRLVHGEGQSYKDRLGKSRKSWAGIEKDFADFLKNSGYELLGDYAAGIEVTAYNQVIRDAGQFWAPAAGTSLPYTTTGAGMDEGGAFVSRGDAVLRQDLADSTPGQGASLVSMEDGATAEKAITDRALRAETIADLSAFSPAAGWQALVSGAPYIYDGAAWVPSGEFTTAKAIGLVGDGVTDNTATWDTEEVNLSDGDKVLFSDGIFLGSFKTKKAISFEFRNAKLRNAVPNDFLLRIGPETGDFISHPVTETELNHLDTQFTVSGASGLFQVGDIGTLWDNGLRPSDDEPVNYEVVKIKDITGDVITVEGFLKSHKGAGAIVFIHSTIQPKNISVKGMDLSPDNTHTFPGFMAYGCENVTIDGSRTENTVGRAIDLRFCYNVIGEDTKIGRPRLVGSGQGYGVALLAVTKATVRDLFGFGTRHLLDGDSVFEFEYQNIHEPDDQSVPLDVFHEGTGGYGSIKDVFVRTKQYAINFSESGFGSGANRVSKQKHPIRNVNIENINITVPASVAPDDFHIPGAYLQNNVDGVFINNLNIRHESGANLTAAASSAAVRINGIPLGAFTLSNVNADKIGRFLLSSGTRDGASQGEQLAYTYNLEADSTVQALDVAGLWELSVDNVSAGSLLGAEVIKMSGVASDNPIALYVGQNIKYQGTPKKIFDSPVTLTGEFAQISRESNASVVVSASYNITAEEVQNRGKYMRLVAPTGAGTVTMGDFPKPYIDGQRILIKGWSSGRQNITIPGTLATVASDITFTSANPARWIISQNGVWEQII